MKREQYFKGRGAQLNTDNRFLENHLVYDEAIKNEKEHFKSSKTQVFVETPKNVINKMTAPDLPNGLSLNPYQGCEHGCVYCYARNTHEYFGFSAGIDFEQKIVVKKNAPELLERAFMKKSYKPQTLLLSGNTDCYQPLERKFEITRKLLEVCEKFNNPVSIITKNTLVLRDRDILSRLASKNLARVFMSITTLNEETRRLLEPRTVSGVKRLKTLQLLHDAGVPVGVMTAPIIPSINDHEIPEIIQKSAENGACTACYTVVRLNGSVEKVFKDWIYKAIPNKADKVMRQIKEMHGGKTADSRVKIRMKGEGAYASHIKQLHTIAKAKYMEGRAFPELNFSLFRNINQLSLVFN